MPRGEPSRTSWSAARACRVVCRPSSAGPHGQFGFLNIFMIEPAKFTDPPTYTATPTLLGRCRGRRLRETLTRNAGRHEAMPLMPLRCSSISSGGAESQVCPRRRMRLCSRNFPGTAAASIHQRLVRRFHGISPPALSCCTPLVLGPHRSRHADLISPPGRSTAA